MTIYLNEAEIEIQGQTTLYALRDARHPEADILIVNGYPATKDQALRAHDRVVMIERGTCPADDVLEALMMARHTPGVHAQLKKGRVGIAGVGGLGSAVALALARSGVGQLVLVDFDVVEPSNLNRQQYFVDQLGEPKVLALKNTLERVNPVVDVIAHHLKITPSNLNEIFKPVDILVEAFDSAQEKAMLTNTFLASGSDKYLVAASGVAGYEPSNTIATKQISERFILCGDGVTAAEPGRGLMAPRVGIAAHHQANAVLRLLLGETVE